MKDKVIQIERPAGLAEIKRHICWTYQEINFCEVPHAILHKTVELCRPLRGPTMVGNFIKANHILSGNTLLIVDKRVSRDLEISTVTGDLSQLAYPSDSMEIRFEDSDLPAILVSRVRKSAHFQHEGIVFAADGKDGGTLTLAIPDYLWKDYADGKWSQDMNAFISDDMEMEESEAIAMKYLTQLAIKVIAYSSVPQFVPKQLETKAEKKNAGLHPKHFTSNQPIFAVRYLPRVVREKKESENASGSTHRFLGRAGHIRLYSDARFTLMRGKWQWLPPLAPPDGVKIIYRVRKPE